ncbi:hypothetical protein SUGI_1522390 [Cryptomeria japonica]|uniref:Uncharacterized protein n=1 Tax=Cryptomeria japonica TaxID=3369 RepID=A0AAD3NPW6_CRYJA|nr:hypothetical protein SUGI_1227920 [Cryptomeria japonica]GLJ59767.1 hypothetical protein SUGI_1522390 [Cryptomeria japonica]
MKRQVHSMPAVLPFSPSIRHPIEGLVFNPPGSLNRTPPSDVKRRMRAIDSLQSERNELRAASTTGRGRLAGWKAWGVRPIDAMLWGEGIEAVGCSGRNESFSIPSTFSWREIERLGVDPSEAATTNHRGGRAR